MPDREPKSSHPEDADAVIILTAWGMLDDAGKTAVLKHFPENLHAKISKILLQEAPDALAQNKTATGDLTPEFSNLIDTRLRQIQKRRIG